MSGTAATGTGAAAAAAPVSAAPVSAAPVSAAPVSAETRAAGTRAGGTRAAATRAAVGRAAVGPAAVAGTGWTGLPPAAVAAGLGLAGAVGVALGVGVGIVAALRRDRPMHTVGETHHAVLHRADGGVPCGVPWLDDPGEQAGLVRFSRGAGLPTWAPDLQGMALRLHEPGGHSDVLLTSAGMRGITRFLLVPRRSPFDGPMTTLMPFRGPHGPVVIAAEPMDSPGTTGRRGRAASRSAGGHDDRFGDGHPDGHGGGHGDGHSGDGHSDGHSGDGRGGGHSGDGHGDRLGAGRHVLTGSRWVMHWSGLTGPWHPYGVLSVGPAAGPEVDRATRFQPVEATPPGLPPYRWAALLRRPAYGAARRLGRRRAATRPSGA